MRVLTVRQPWAYAIIYGGKDVENRTRNIAGNYRGPIAIHAGLQHAKLTAAKLWNSPLGDMPITTDPRLTQVTGVILGIVDLVNVCTFAAQGTTVGMTPAGRKYTLERECSSQWAESGAIHLELENPRPITPIPATGRLGLWRPDERLLAQLTAALEFTKCPACDGWGSIDEFSAPTGRTTAFVCPDCDGSGERKDT